MLNLFPIILDTDSYKVSMWKQYPKGTEYVYSYIESRGGEFDSTVLFGVQYFIKQYLLHPVTQEQIDFADEFYTAHGEPFNREGWQYILDKHNGYLPLSIRSAPEGLRIPVGNVLVTIENTDPKVPWLTTWVETSALRCIWYGTTVATLSREIKDVILEYLIMSGDVAGQPYKHHDFGSRGVSSQESAVIGDMAHLISSSGTDTTVGLYGAYKFYGADLKTTAHSIPAAEHSTVTSWGRTGEKNQLLNMIKQFGGEGKIFADVGDSYNIYDFCKMVCDPEIKAALIESKATFVIRPDSGEPVEVLRKCLSVISRGYGYTTNGKGFRVLNHIRFLWGDGINLNTIKIICLFLVGNDGWSLDNFAFGMGGALLQMVNRDSQKFAMKCSSVGIRQEDGTLKWVDVFKDPITDSSKASKKGRVVLYQRKDGTYYSGKEDWNKHIMDTVYEDGKLTKSITFEEIRANSNK